MPFHLRAENEFRLQFGDPRLDFQIVVGDQRLDAVPGGRVTDFARELPRVGAESDDREAKFFRCDPGGCDGVAGIAKDENPLAGQVS